MNSFPNLCIDPYLIAIPKIETSTKDDIENFVSSIIDWSKTFKINGMKALVSNAVLDAIDEDGSFPWLDRIDGLLKHYKVNVADANTIFTAMKSFFNCSKIEDTVGLNALLIEPDKTDLAPPFVFHRLRAKTQSALFDMLAMIVLIGQGFGKDVEQVALASIPNDNSKSNLQYLSFSTEVVEFDWNKNSDFQDIRLPHTINDHISVFFSRNGLLENIEPLSLWPSMNDAYAACSAIDCCIERIIANGTKEKKKKPYTIGRSFLETAQSWECGHKGTHAFTLIESCARIVLDIPKNEVKPFYNRETGRQRTRNDGALAFRTHLTKKGAGLRLMLWKMSDGIIEFANVGDKDELIIL